MERGERGLEKEREGGSGKEGEGTKVCLCSPNGAAKLMYLEESFLSQCCGHEHS